jgi:hypothetical protein
LCKGVGKAGGDGAFDFRGIFEEVVVKEPREEGAEPQTFGRGATDVGQGLEQVP